MHGRTYSKGDRNDINVSIKEDKIFFSEEKKRIGTSKSIYLYILIMSSIEK